VACGHRTILLSRHNQDDQAVADSHPAPPRTKITISGWNTKQMKTA
jgi:hypothetical protein